MKDLILASALVTLGAVGIMIGVYSIAPLIFGFSMLAGGAFMLAVGLTGFKEISNRPGGPGKQKEPSK